MLLALFVTSGVMTAFPVVDSGDSILATNDMKQNSIPSQSVLNASIPYVDEHYGYADGIIDPTEYAYTYTDLVSGITVYLEHNSSILFVGLSARTSGWIGIGWKNYTDDFTTEGLNGSDLIYGYAPGTPHSPVIRVTGDEPITVHYILKLRNGTVLEEGDVPNDESTTPFKEETLLLPDYIDNILGMRIGEIRNFIIPAEIAYNQSTHPLYGEDLEYIVKVTRIAESFQNPADASEIIYSEEYGISTYQHQTDDNQSQVLASGGSDDGTNTQLEYFIQMNSTDIQDVPLLNDSEISYPLMLLYSDSEDITQIPTQHNDWANPLGVIFIPNAAPEITFETPIQDGTYDWILKISANVTDNSWIRRAFYKVDDENWTEIFYKFKTDLWETQIDLSSYVTGLHTVWLNATDPSNVTSINSVNISVDRPYQPLLGMRLDVVRTVYTKLYHLTEIVDTFTIENNGSVVINSIDIYLPENWYNYQMSISAEGEDETVLKILDLGLENGMRNWKIFLAEGVNFGESYTLTIVTFYHSLHTLTDYDNEIYEVCYLRYPVVPYVLRRAQLGVEFRSGDSLNGESPEGLETNIAPMEVEEVTMSIKSFTPVIVADRHTEVKIDPWGWLNYHETITLRNIGPTRELTLSFNIPEGSTTIKIYDKVGILAKSQPGGTWYTNETVTLQIDLRSDRFGQDALLPNYQYTFNIDYTMELSTYQTPVISGTKLNLPMATLGEVLIEKHIVDAILSYSVATVEASDGYRLLYGVFDNTLRYTYHNTTNQNPPDIYIVYQTSLLSSSRPLAFSLIFGLIAIIYVGYRAFNPPVDKSLISRKDDEDEVGRVSGAPPDLLSTFASLYSRKTALNLDMEKLEASRRRGKVSKKEYMIRERDLKSQIDEVESELPEMKEKLISYGPKYRDMIAQLELQNERIEGAKAGLRQLLLRKKKQKISRVAFEKSRQDYLKTIKKATSATDRMLLSIQEEAGDI